MKNKWIVLVVLLGAGSLVAQVSSPRYALSMELGGSAGHQSVNFTLLPSTASGLSTEFGLGLLYGQNPTLVVPVSINYLKRRNEKTVWKYGLGVTFSRLDFISLSGNQPDDKGLYVNLVPAVTYLRTYPDGFFWGLKFSPILGNGGGIPWGGVQLGFFF
jgi:hypothetical protein